MRETKLLNFQNAAVLAAAILILVMIFIPPALGVADDGNLFSTAQSAGIFGDISSANATFSYEKDNSAIAGNNTQVLVLSLLKNVMNGIDTRVLAALFSLIFLLCVYFSLKTAKTETWWLNLIAAVLVVLIFTDQAYIAYLNSIHQEAFLFIGLLSVFACGYLLTREKTSVLPMIFFALAAAAFIYTSQALAFAGILLTIYAFRVMMVKKKRSIKLTALFTSLLLLVVSILTPLWEVPAQREMNVYNSVFYGISMTSDNFEADLKELGLDSSLKMLSKTSYFDKNQNGMTDETLAREFFQKIDYGSITWFYIKHPARFFRLASMGANNCTTLKIGYLANYDRAAGKDDNATSYFYTGYSTLKPRIIPGSLAVQLFFLAAFIAFMVKFRANKGNTKNQNLMYEFFIVLALIGLGALFSPVYYHGLASIAKTMFLYNAVFDLLLTITIAGGASLLYRRRKRLQKDFGVVQ